MKRYSTGKAPFDGFPADIDNHTGLAPVIENLKRAYHVSREDFEDYVEPEWG